MNCILTFYNRLYILILYMIYLSEMKQIVITILSDINPSNQSPSSLPGAAVAPHVLKLCSYCSSLGLILSQGPLLHPPPLFFFLYKPVATTLLYYWLPGGLFL